MRKFLGRMIWPVLCGILLAVVLLDYLPQFIGQRGPSPLHGNEQSVVRRDSYANAVEKAAPAVVTVSSWHAFSGSSPKSSISSDPIYEHGATNNLPPSSRSEGGAERLINLGSGVIVSHSGYILTNNHVIRSADRIVVTLADGRTADAHVVGADSETDLAVLKISLNHLPTVKFADNYRVRTGDIAMAIGNPYSIGQSVTMGIVSGVGRVRVGVSPYEDFIQTDASINPGNSGGALIDADGRLIGINTAIFSRSVGSQGIGFAIPIRVARSVLDMIIKYGHVERGYLGIDATQAADPDDSSASVEGGNLLQVSQVAPNGPGADAGVHVGDIIQAINGVPLLNPYAALNEIANLRPGTIISMTLLRNNSRVLVHITTGIRPANLESIANSAMNSIEGNTTPRRTQTPSYPGTPGATQQNSNSSTNGTTTSPTESNSSINTTFPSGQEEWNTPYEPHLNSLTTDQ